MRCMRHEPSEVRVALRGARRLTAVQRTVDRNLREGITGAYEVREAGLESEQPRASLVGSIPLAYKARAPQYRSCNPHAHVVHWRSGGRRKSVCSRVRLSMNPQE